jgi:hypothetical protein
MASLQTLERRIATLEARLADVEGGYGDTLYKLHRASVKADLRTARILERLEIENPDLQPPASEFCALRHPANAVSRCVSRRR